jgi:hypothetical protein
MPQDAQDEPQAFDPQTAAGAALAAQMADSTEPETPAPEPPPETPPAEPEAPSTAPDAVPEAAQPEATADPGEPAEPAEDDEVSVRSVYDKITGYNASAKYRNDYDFLRGMAEAQRMLGQRNVDAELGRSVRGKFQSQEELAKFLQGEPETPAPKPAESPVLPADSFEQVRLWQQQIATAQAAGQEPPADAVRNLEVVSERMQRLMFDLAKDPSKVLAPVLESYTPQIQQQLQQQQQQQEAQKQQADWIGKFEEANKDWLTGGKPVTPDTLTPEGHRFMQHVHAEQQRGRSPAEALYYGKLAFIAERQSQPAPTPTAAVKPQAVHKPAVAPAPQPDPKKQYEEDVKNLSLREHLAKLLKQQAASAGVKV